MEKLRLIQCGVGGFGSGWVREVVQSSPDFELAAIVDVSDETLRKAGEAVNIGPALRFKTLEDALARVRADAVLTVTPPAVHAEHARLAFQKGLHFITEKPLADNIANAKEMVKLAAAAGLQLVVSQNYRYKPQVALLSQLIASGGLGALGHGHVDFYIAPDFGGSFRESMKFPLLVDMCIHHVDLLRAITGLNVRTVSVLSFRPSWSWFSHHTGLKMLIEMENGVAFSYSGDWSAHGRSTPWDGNWRMQCAEAALHWDDGRVSVSRSEKWNKNLKIEYPEVPTMEFQGQKATLHSLAEAIRSGKPAPTSGQDNLNSFGTVMAAVLSAEQGRLVNVRELTDD